jgi:hypothetical protein
MTETNKPTILATLLLERPARIDYAKLVERIGPTLQIEPQSIKLSPDGTGAMVAGGDLVMGMHFDLPYPEDLSNLAAFAHWWPTARQDIARCKAHLTMASSGSRHSRLDAHLRHMVLMRELVEQLPVIGVLWGSVLTPPENFKGEFQAAMNGQLPILVWVLIQHSQQPNGNCLVSTLGMRDFGHMEIETESSLPMQETYALVRNLATYVISKDVRLPDGDTVGLSEQHRIKTRHARSFRPGVNEVVLWLELTDKPSLAKPKGFFSRVFGSGAKN